MNLIQYITVSMFLIVGSLKVSALTPDVEVTGPAPISSVAHAGPSEQECLVWVDTLIENESSGDAMMIGDNDRTNKAYGPLQVRKTVVDDVNKQFHWHYRAEECLGNLGLSFKIFYAYQSIWATEDKIGHKVTMRDMFRIWNGGPRGFEHENTLGYWAKSKAIYAHLSKKHRRHAAELAAQ